MQLENVDDVYALSPIQEGMLFHSISAPDSGVFVEQIIIAISGDLDRSTFKRSWQDLVQQHPTLRTMFLWDGLDEPLQVVRQSVSLDWTEIDLSTKPKEQLDDAVEHFLRSDRRRGIDLSHAPLMRMTLVDAGRNAQEPQGASQFFVWTFHHLLTDGWSTSLLIREVFERYASKLAGSDFQTNPSLAYGDFIAHLDGIDDERAREFWREQLSGYDSPLRLRSPSFNQRTTSNDPVSFDRTKLTLSRELTKQARELARQSRVTLNTVLLGAWAILLSRYCRSEDVVFGTTVSGRQADLPGIENAIGVFINTLPIRIRCNDATLSSWLRGIQQQQVAARNFEHSSLSMIQRCADIKRGEPLFESIVVFENYPEAAEFDQPGCGFQIEAIDYREQSNYPFALLVVPKETIDLHLVFDEAVASLPLAQQLLAGLARLLESFSGAPDRSVIHHGLLSPSEQQAVLARNSCNGQADRDPQTVVSLIDRAASQRPDAVALVDGDRSMTYRMLDRHANRIAKQLIESGASPNDLVGVMAERSCEMIAGILGVLRAGAAYVPLDPEYPRSRTTTVLEDARIELVLASAKFGDRMSGEITIMPLAIDDDCPDQPRVDVPIKLDQIAYVIYTSGSQGRPKGVPITHRNLVSSTLARRPFYGEPVGAFLLLSSFAFDSSVAGIFWTLTDGGKLVLPPPGSEKDLEVVSNLIAREQVTHTLCLPTLYELLLDNTPADLLSSCRYVTVAGEACSPTTIARHFQRNPSARLFNEYGPTEATVWCIACELLPEHTAGPVPIGKPIAGIQAMVLDAHRNLLPDGVIGELYVAGDGLARGYLGNAKLTEEHFVSHPFAGEGSKMYRTGDLVYQDDQGVLFFRGRVDQQVKVRGHRIELAEIENTLLQDDAIQEAVVVATSRDSILDESVEIDDLVKKLEILGTQRAMAMLQDVTGLSADDVENELSEGS